MTLLNGNQAPGIYRPRLDGCPGAGDPCGYRPHTRDDELSGTGGDPSGLARERKRRRGADETPRGRDFVAPTPEMVGAVPVAQERNSAGIGGGRYRNRRLRNGRGRIGSGGCSDN